MEFTLKKKKERKTCFVLFFMKINVGAVFGQIWKSMGLD